MITESRFSAQDISTCNPGLLARCPHTTGYATSAAYTHAVQSVQQIGSVCFVEAEAHQKIANITCPVQQAE